MNDDDLFDEPIPSTQPKIGERRKINSSPEGLPTKISKLQSTIATKLIENDINKVLSIHQFNIQTDDPSVNEYLKLLEQTNVLPIIPHIEELKKAALHQPNVQLNNTSYIYLIRNFMSVFQAKYSQNNLQEATEREICVTNPQAKLSLPNFHLLPAETLTKFTKLRKSMGLQIQAAAQEGMEFNSELLILRNINHITDELKQLNDYSTDNLSHFFSITYLKAECEFVKKFNIKCIDWNERKCKVSHAEPEWRKQKQKVVPQEAFNLYSREISNRIENNQESFDGNTVSSTYQDFINQGTLSSQRMREKGMKKNLYRNQSHPEQIESHGRKTLEARRRNNYNENQSVERRQSVRRESKEPTIRQQLSRIK